MSKNRKNHTWDEDCLHWMGMILTGDYKHYCPDWDDLPIDETCTEFGGCTCYLDDPKAQALVKEREQEMNEIILDDELFEDWDIDFENDDGEPWGWEEDD